MRIEMSKQEFIKAVALIIALLWAAASLYKLGNYNKTLWAMRNQVFPLPVADVLAWLIPVIQIMFIPMLLYKRWMITGIKLSLILLALYTLYIILSMTKAFGEVPCSCAGFLDKSDHATNLIFNILFVTLLAFAVWFNYKDRKSRKAVTSEKGGVVTNIKL